MDGVVSLCKPFLSFLELSRSFLEVRSRFARANLELARGSGSLILQLFSAPSSMNFFAVSLRYLLVRSLTPHDLLLEK